MADLWNEEAKFRAWLRIELAVCRARASLGEIPAEEAEELAQKADFTTQRVKEIEKETNHDVIAFVTAVAETVAETGAADVARHFHFGLTSSDVLDTAGALQLKEALGLIREEAESLAILLCEMALAHRGTVIVGRTHEVLSALAILGSTLEKVALEIRGAQRTEVRELAEPFGRGQKGSSAMPHKRNPILAERLCGMARLLRGYAGVGFENNALWQERDISHSSAERVVLPDSTTLAHYMLRTTQRVLQGLQVDKDRMRENLNLGGGIIYSGRVLLSLVEAGMGRDEAYAVVQGAAMRAWEGEGDFRELLEADGEVRNRLGEDLDSLFDPSYALRNLNVVFDRVEDLRRRLESV